MLEVGHVFAHVLICGGLAFLVARRGASLRALALALGVGAAIEAAQWLALGAPWHEAAYDLCVDAVAAVAGVLLASRDEPAGHVASAVLHPLVVAPAGFTMAVFASSRDPGFALGWTALAAACFVPSVALWAAGIRGGWWTDADLSDRAERGPLFGVACLCLAGFGLVAAGGPDPVPRLAGSAIGGALLGTTVTLAGLKVSGHVAIPAAIGLLVLTASPRAATLLLATAVVLSWARMVARRHRAVEVAAAWGLAAVLAMLA